MVQEIVDRSAWASGNAMVFVLEGTGRRTAEGTYDRPGRPRLLIQLEDGTGGGSSEEPSGGSGGTADTTPPSVTLNSPADNAKLSGTVTLTATAADNVGVASVNFRWDSVSFAAPDGSAPYSYSWDTTKFDDGDYTLTAVAVDAAGNKTVSNLVTVTVANAAPDPGSSDPEPAPQWNGATLRVPQDYSSIQSAINAAKSGDTVLVSPGTYSGGLTISGKAITLASMFHATGSASYIDSTTLSGGTPIITVADTGANSRIIGFRLTNGSKGVVAHGKVEVLNNNFDNVGSDQMSFERASGVVRGNRFYSASDDGIDIDGGGEILIANNVIIDSGDDGIELRNYTDTGSSFTVTIRGNTISNSGEDGIQLIDYPGTASRRFLIERNVITGSTDAGLGLMDNGETLEDFRAASMPERIHLFNNTFVANRYGVTGGDNMFAVNNIVANSSAVGMKGIDGGSKVAYTLFYGNSTNQQGSAVDAATTKTANPLLTGSYVPGSGSPAIDAGTARYVWNGETVLNLSSGEYAGDAPDLGAKESGL
jgi:hypothetical protein